MANGKFLIESSNSMKFYSEHGNYTVVSSKHKYCGFSIGFLAGNSTGDTCTLYE